MEMLESISVIGGADGPTSIFLAGVISKQILVASIVIGLILCIFGLRLMKLLSAVVGLLIGAGIGAAVAKLIVKNKKRAASLLTRKTCRSFYEIIYLISSF